MCPVIQKNEGKSDRIIRLIVAGFSVLAALLLASVQYLSIVFIVIAFIMLLTAITGFCPLYTLFGINTINKQK